MLPKEAPGGDDTEKIKELLEETIIDFSKGDIFLDGKNVNKEIRKAFRF